MERRERRLWRAGTAVVKGQGAATAAPALRKRRAAIVASMEGREQKSSRLLDSRDYGSSACGVGVGVPPFPACVGLLGFGCQILRLVISGHIWAASSSGRPGVIAQVAPPNQRA
jgi:hypothetical protein